MKKDNEGFLRRWSNRKKSIENIEHIAANEEISFKEALAKQKILQDKPAKAVRKLIKNLNSWKSKNIDEHKKQNRFSIQAHRIIFPGTTS